MLRRLTALGLALCHAVLLSGATSLHTHGLETAGLDLAVLPAQYHHHDFGYTAGGGDPTPAHDECIGCRLERSVGLPLPAAPGLLDGASGLTQADAPLGAPSSARLDDLLPRAPPLA